MLIAVTYESWTIIFKTFILLGRQELASIFVHFQGLPEVFKILSRSGNYNKNEISFASIILSIIDIKMSKSTKLIRVE